MALPACQIFRDLLAFPRFDKSPLSKVKTVPRNVVKKPLLMLLTRVARPPAAKQAAGKSPVVRQTAEAT
jgi:hypothetical protein